MTDFKINYKEQYDSLISYRLLNKLEKSKEESGKTETHHILPRSCGGTDDPENLVNLYAKEHFMAHYYLWKMHENDEFKCQMLNAFWMMCIMSSSSQERTYQEYIKMSQEYQEARIQFAKYLSTVMPEKVNGSKNGQFGKHWYYDPLTNESHPYIEGQQPTGWILGKRYKDPKAFKLACKHANQNKCWIISVDTTKQKKIDKDIAKQLVATGNWKFGHLSLSNNAKLNKKIKSNTFKARYPMCLNCGKPNPNMFAICCCSSCKEEFTQKKEKERLEEKRKLEANEIEKQQQFRAQVTELYKGVVDRKQVRRYLEFKGKQACNCCGKENVKLTVHAIDGNCKNLSIDNYEFLCHECYVKSGTSGFSGHSMAKINQKKQNN